MRSVLLLVLFVLVLLSEGCFAMFIHMLESLEKSLCHLFNRVFTGQEMVREKYVFQGKGKVRGNIILSQGKYTF